MMRGNAMREIDNRRIGAERVNHTLHNPRITVRETKVGQEYNGRLFHGYTVFP
jgi:hypothetical protein